MKNSTSPNPSPNSSLKFYLSKNKNKRYYVLINNFNPETKKTTHQYKSLKTSNKRIALNNFSRYVDNYYSNNEPEVINKNITIQDFYSEVLKYLETNLRIGTIKIYRIAVKNFIRIVGDKPIRLFTEKDAEDYKVQRLKEVSRSTINIDIATLKALFNIAVKLNYINNNIWKGIKKMKINDDKVKVFSELEIDLLLNNITNKTLLNIVKFALLSGLRLDEILNLKLKNIDFGNETIYIEHSKTGSKTIILNDKLKNLLNEIFKINNETNILNLALISPDKYLFTSSKRNYKFAKTYVSGMFKKELRKLNLSEDLHFHSLRHTYISGLINKGVPLNFVKELVKHSSINTTMRYITLSKSELLKYANA